MTGFEIFALAVFTGCATSLIVRRLADQHNQNRRGSCGRSDVDRGG